ncbi:hypothetical protein GCM10022262_39140 [Georgenia daeguensis]|uniref:Uncharacterized protein n=1 Tax=Georgenia daeguensis TaxID=908355 RepID=A0ABP6UL62_9MICO
MDAAATLIAVEAIEAVTAELGVGPFDALLAPGATWPYRVARSYNRPADDRDSDAPRCMRERHAAAPEGMAR